MRIGMMVDLFTPHMSGVTNYVLVNQRWLEAQGHSVSVFTFGPRRAGEPGVVRSPGLGLTFRGVGLHLALWHAPAVRRQIEAVDVIHVHHPFISGSLALRYARRRRVPVVFTSHTRYDLYLKHYTLPGAEPIGRLLLRAYLPRFCRACDLVIVPSAGARAALQGIGVRSTLTVVPNGTDLSAFASPAGFTRSEAGLPDGAPVLMYMGRVSPEKELAFLLRAFARAELQTAVLAIVGGGPSLAGLKRQAAALGLADRVRFFGHVPPERIPAHLHLADAFVTPSQTEVHPFSLIEALAAGLPALGIGSPGIDDTLTDGVDGLISGPALEEFAAGLTRLATDAELRRRLGAGARRTAQRYSLEVTGRAVLAEYERLLRART